MVVSSLAGKPADPSILIDIYKLVTGARLPLVIIHLIRNTFRADLATVLGRAQARRQTDLHC